VGSVRIDDHVGRVLSGRYRLISALGTGASAHVYVADDITLRRRVAVKVLHPDLANEPIFLRRFRAEAQAVAALRHPNIVAVHDWGEDGDTPYLVCELLEGGSLRALLDTGYLLSPAQAALIGLEAARGLDYAHRRGLVHRDVKPANLLFDDEGRLCIADFGVARALAEAALTEPQGTMIGTARYASPEQVRGASLDGRSDVYSLGLVLIEAVTGQVPFATDTTLGTLLARVETPVEVPEALGDLAAVVGDACQMDPADRVDAGQLRAALEELAHRLPPAEALPILDSHTVSRDRSAIDLRHIPDYRLERAERPDRTAHGEPGRHADLPPGPLYDQAGPRAANAAPRTRRWPIVVLVLALLAGAGGGVAFVRSRHQPPKVLVPAVARLTRDAAASRLLNLHLKMRIAGQQYQDGTAAGDVLTQIPETGTVREGSVVAVVLSLGPPPVPIPDLTNMTLDEATAALAGAGLKVGRVTTPFNDTVDKGKIITWSPTGVPLPRGDTVDLTVSGGKEQMPVPDLSNAKNFADAQAQLAAAGLTATEQDSFSNSVRQGQIISINPPAGTLVTKGTAVVVQISKGPDVVAVPDVRTMPPAAAQAALQAAGLTPGFTYGPLNGTVFATNPPRGSVVLRGTTVNIYTQ
jgi:serine/threonine-protein kinase